MKIVGSCTAAIILTAAAAAQETITLRFDGGGPESGVTTPGTTSFSFMGSNWSGGGVNTSGILALYASGSFSYEIAAGGGRVTFDFPVDRVNFFYVHGFGFSQGTATAFDAAGMQLASVNSRPATSFGAPANFVALDPPEPIARIEFSAGVIDNFSFTTTDGGEGEGNGEPIENPIFRAIPLGNVVIELETIVDGLTAPLGIRFPGDGTGRMLIYDQSGVVIALDPDGNQTIFLDVRDRLVDLGVGGPGTFDERGLIGFTLHPNFAENGLVYTYTSEPADGQADFTLDTGGEGINHHAVFAEWQAEAAKGVIANSRREWLRVEQPQFNHNGGTMHYGPDGYLYIAFGDGGGANDIGPGHGDMGNGQNLNTLHGSLLRVDVDLMPGNILSANGQYAIPAGNPFVNDDGLDEIYAYGLRNPYAFSFDTETGDLWLADVGQNDIEEVNIITAGGNYGWRFKEGSFFFNPDGGFVTNQSPYEDLPPDLIDPVAEYDHDEGISIIGGFVYRGTEIPALAGRYVTGDFSTGFGAPDGRLFFLDEAKAFFEFQLGAENRPYGLFLKGFAQGPGGEIYVLGSTELGPFGTGGVIQKIVPGPEPPGPVGCPLSASQHGTPINNARGDLLLFAATALLLLAAARSARMSSPT